MEQGFIRVGAATPQICVADPVYNRGQIEALVREAAARQVKVIVFPELCLTGYTCGDLFLQDTLLDAAKEELAVLADHTKDWDILIFVGLPWAKEGQLYNVMAAVKDGQILGLVPKTFIPNYSEFYEARHFRSGSRTVTMERLRMASGIEDFVPMGADILFQCTNMDGLVIGAEVCEDVWVPNPPSGRHALAGATLIVNSSASDETTGKGDYRRSLIGNQSAKLVCGYVYADAGEGESSTDLVFAGHNVIYENGTLLKESGRFTTGLVCADMDLERLQSDRRRLTTFGPIDAGGYMKVSFSLRKYSLDLERFVDPAPFVPGRKEDRDRRCEEILSIQAMGLKKRFSHTGCKNAVVGISGGLDSTLALLATARAFDLLGLSRDHITAVTMPCFGTTDRTYNNACELTRRLGAELIEVDIKESVMLHFRDIGHDPEDRSVAYENSQARERTQVLMDIANRSGGMVIGTGDMSELALGWATYNGDHMSMYGVNASVPKTLVRHLVRYCAETCEDEKLAGILLDVLDTPVSPELLPPEEGKISQKTEDIVGPYELHDFFLYYILRFGYRPAKICRLAEKAFCGTYQKETILKWLTTFYRRFFSQQFKRSCLPDGPKVGSVAVSPRGDLRMPSDASARLWLSEVEKLAGSDELK
ncbi:NAD(+) synthase [Lacrimispora sp. NSJ-141]|uniref:Glutamine-dependent NAD(+) synthetase n=1 Tax=Lientehia hominis TaxID=2897778 RepID=A0AAP2RJT3_9FIRM|nr:NAD(+) synthase [Lientehia hominis]MCD2492920.1 NAD(+) synthase [Lientehia hominis]